MSKKLSDSLLVLLQETINDTKGALGEDLANLTILSSNLAFSLTRVYATENEYLNCVRNATLEQERFKCSLDMAKIQNKQKATETD